MVGQAVLRECLLDPAITSVLTLCRTAPPTSHPKLRHIPHADLFDLTAVEAQLTNLDACFFCVGVTSVGMKDNEYRHLTYDLTLSVARTLQRLNPAMAFIYISGQGTDPKSSLHWARVKGETESALLELFPRAYMFRPGYIQPMHGVRAKIAWYNAVYAVLGPLYPLLKRVVPSMFTSSEAVARAMLRAAQHGAPKRVLETPDINALASTPALN